MNAGNQKFEFSSENMARVKAQSAKYPDGRQASATLALLDEEKGQIRIVAGHGFTPNEVRRAHLGVGQGITGRVIDYQGEEFAHEIHVEEEELACADCHQLDDGELGLDLDFCVDCHD